MVNQYQKVNFNSPIKNFHVAEVLKLRHLAFYSLFSICYDYDYLMLLQAKVELVEFDLVDQDHGLHV